MGRQAKRKSISWNIDHNQEDIYKSLNITEKDIANILELFKSDEKKTSQKIEYICKHVYNNPKKIKLIVIIKNHMR